MRDLLLTGIIGFLLVQTLRHSWIGAMLWTWLSLMNPHRLTYSFAYSLPFAQITAVTALVSLLWNRRKVRLPMDATVLALIAFMVWMCITTVFAIHAESSQQWLERALKIQVMTLFCIAVIRERKHIELFVWVNFLSIGFYGIKGGIFAITSGGAARVWGPADSFIYDNNAMGLALVTILPMGFYLWQVSVNKWVRRGLLTALLLCAVAALSTQSRGAFLALAGMGLVLWTRARQKVVAVIFVMLFGVMLLAFMPQSWENRMRSIQTYEQDASAMSRINAWETAVNIANDRPTGAGFSVASREIFTRYAPNPEWVYTAHSIYFQALGEHGWIGLALFLSLGFLSFRNSAFVRKRAKERPETAWAHDLAGMMQISMVGFGVGGAFLSLAYWDLPYNLLVVLIACKYWMVEERWQVEKVGAFGATSAEAVARQNKPPATAATA